jgi:4-alpha-glucanotransferase
MIRAASASVADVCIFPVQDVLALGSEARMNTPATPENNWTWRMNPDALSCQQAQGLAQLAELTDRDGWVEPPKA